MKEKLNNVVEYVKENPVICGIYAIDAVLIGISGKFAIHQWRLYRRLDRRTEALMQHAFGHDI